MQDLHAFFKELRFSAGAIWLKDEAIKFSAPVKFQNFETDQFIIKNKDKIKAVLKENGIDSKLKFVNSVILKDPVSEQQILSFAQERLWFIEQYEEGSNAYHIPIVLELLDGVDVEGIKYAIGRIVSRHEVLRSTIDMSADQRGIQVVHTEALQVESISVSAGNFESILKAEINDPFDLRTEYPVRVKVYDLNPDGRRILLINIHHIASDGWSMGVFQSELLMYYESYVRKDNAFSLPALEIQYKDYAIWQRSYLSGDLLKDQLGYWVNKFAGYQNLSMPTDYVRPSQVSYRGSYESFIISKEVSDCLRSLSRKHGVTLNSVLLSSIKILLSKYTGQEDIVVGSPIANRHHRQTENLIGFFVNMQASRTILNGSESYSDLVVKVHQDQIESQRYQDLPFEMLVDALAVERDPSKHPIFQVSFGLQSFSSGEESSSSQANYFKAYTLGDAYEVEKFDLSFYIDDSAAELNGQVSYAVSLFTRSTISRMIGHYVRLLTQLAENPAQPYSQINLLSSGEYSQIVEQWNRTEKPYRQEATLHELFYEQVARSSESVALVYGDSRLSYGELNQRSNQLARYIRQQYLRKTGEELKADTLIALCLDRSPEMVIGILAVLKAGGAYVPIDPEYPQERIDYMLEDTGAQLVLTHQEIVDRGSVVLPSEKVLLIDLTSALYQSESSSDLDVNGSSSDLAYVIYTSGTTGRPKGVMVEHRGVINLGFQQKEKFNLTAGTKVLQYASLVFDASVWEIFSSLITGGELHVVPDTIRRDSQLLIDYMDGHGINLALIPPALLGAMPFRMLSELRTLLVGGESCPSDLMHQWSVGRRLVNAYGPTEYTVIAAMHEYAQGDLHTNIGKPLSNTEVYVLDSFGQVVPVGVAGELYIGGSGIARGYLNNRELTSEHFLPNRFKGDGSRLYRTGDLVRWLADGNLEYLGRNDEQVKIRGYRIELGEIEHALLKLEGIRQASVLCKERKSGSSVSKYLVGYYVSDVEWSPDRITDELSSVLPEYMVPAVYVRLEHFPLTVNGKLDKMKLPDPEFGSEESYVGPSTELEEKMCLIWQDVLGISRVGVQDDFFRIGGNSILAIRVSHRMSETLGVEIKVADVFKHKTISRLLLYQLGKDQVIIPRSVGDSNALSFAQERLWFIEQYEEGSNAYHIPIVLELLDGVDVEGIKYAIGRIVSRHEVLRSTIDMSADQRGIQVVHTEALQVESISVSAGNFESILKAEINDPFDLRTEYPVRVKVYDLNPDGRRILLINIHHIASDGWSMGVFQSELLMYYESYVRKDNAFSLPALEIQYKDYAIWQRSYLSGDLLKDQLGYWVNKFAGYQNLSMPTDYVRPSQVSYRGSYESFIISKEVSDCLRSLSRKHGVTLNSVLLSSIKILLSKYTGQEDIVVGSPIANRHHRQTENLIGFFVNMQASRTILNGSESYSDLVVKVHQDQIESQRYQDLPFEMLVDALAVERDPSKHPIFQVSFGLQSFSSGEESSSSQANYFKAYTLGDAYEVEKFDLSFYIDDSAAELNGQVSYAVSLFTRSTISRMIGHYVRLLTQLAENPAQPYSQINLLSSGEYSQIVEQWNRTEKPYRQEATLHELFYEQVARSSESVALVYGDSRLSYGELNQRSNQLARYIRQQYLRKTGEELKADTLIALCLDRSPEMVIGILAVLKAGGAYVPIDPEYPQERIDYMLEDTGAQLVLTHQEIVDRGSVVLPSEKVLLIDLTSALYQSESSSDLDVNGSSSDLAYVIYTSGTTGRPKGVMVEHRSIHNTIADLYSLYREGLKVSAYTSYVFDVSVSEIFSTLLQGSELHLLPQSIRTDSVAISEYLQSNKIVLAYLPPVMLSQLPVVEHPHLKTLIYAGEPCDKYTAGQWSSRVKLYNYYGPTEASVYATFKEIGSDEVEQIGKPLSNTEVYVLDSFGQVVPVGVAGELYIGGSGIARGYLNNRELTSERFLPNRFKGDGSRLYRTGDLVRWLADGNLEYLGRNDEQVKIRGYRIELGEIEHALLKLEGIRQASVLCKERKSGSSVSKYLVGYYVSDVEWSPDRITDELSSVLPEYMVPAVYVRLEHFPLTVNGKLDKRALPDSEFVSTKDYVAPATDTEIAISQIWQEVLGLDRVGLKDDFFRIGGDSILSIQVSSRIRQAGYHCQVKDIFSYKTLEKLSAHLDNNQGGLAIKSEQGLLAGSFELLPVQQWFAEQVENGLFAKPSHWNQSILLRVPALDQSRLYSIIKELVSYHDVLRISYQKGEPAKSWHQLYKPEIPIPELRTLDVREHTELELHQLLTDWQSGFDLEGPLFQAGYLYGYGDGSARLYFSMHHLIVDGVSWRILAEDIKTLYEGRKLPAKGSSYRQWVSSVSQYAVDHAGESVYWERQLSGLPSYESLRSQQVDHSSATLMELPAELTKTLLQESSKAYHTEINDLLLTALAYALRDINQHEVQGITLEGHGREAIDSSIDHSRTIGWFTTMFPVSLELQSTLKESIQGIKESLRRIPNKGIGFGAFATREHSGFSHDNLAPISFNYLGQFGSHQAEDWQPAPEGSGVSMDGANGDRYLININGMVSGGKLCFTVVTRLGDKITQQLGDSLKTHLTGIIHHCEEQLVTVGECYTPSDFKEVSLSQGLLDQLQTRAQESQNGIAHIYTATSLQQGFIYHALSQSEDDAYRVQVLYDYHQGLDVDKYIEAWELCIAQYPILRTAFNWEEELVQIIYKRGKLNWKFHDISHLESQAERDAAIEAIQIEDRKQGFDLSKPTLLRLHIMKQSVEYYTVLKSEHHSISDGWSVPILLTSIHQNYQALVVGKQVSVKEDTAYLTAQQYISSNRESVSDYWSKTLSEVESVNDINGLLSEPLNLSSYKQVEESKASILTVEGDLYKSLKALSQREGITISVMVQFLWHKLLQVYSGSKQTIVGTTVSGRDLPVAGIEQSVGLYINTLPLIIDWENDNTILSQLHLLQDQLRGLSTHSFANLAKLQRDGERLFHSLFVYENYPLPKDAGTHEKGGAARVSLRKAIEKVDYPLSILAFEQGDTLTIKLQYDGLYLTDQKASSHIETLKYILEQVVKDPGQRHGKISLLSSPQYSQIVEQWNRTEKPYRQEATLHELFYEQVARSSESVALVYGDSRLSYGELNQRSNQLARYIRQQYLRKTGEELKADTLIALCLDRSPEMVIGILAVLKAGGAYVPIDPEYPQERIDYMLEDTGAQLVLTHQEIVDRGSVVLPSEKVLLIDLTSALYQSESSSDLDVNGSSSDLAYVIYTSGTTGRPKGVMVEHRSIHNTIADLYSLYREGLKVSAYTSYVFDVSVSEIFSTLLQGSELHLLPQSIRTDSVAISEYLQSNKIVLAYLPPVMLSQLPVVEHPHLKTLIYAGEPCDKYTAGQWSSRVKLYNYYGPTEASVYATFKEIGSDEVEQIGKPLSNTEVYVLDSFGQVVPVGVAGELYIGGSGIARGYLNNRELTSERFLPNRFKGDGSRLYRTGDLVRWLADGNLEYLGRNDEQVKIRGYRIELGEIEHALLKLEGIRQASVLCKERKSGSSVSKYLVGYYVSDVEWSPDRITDELSSVLPEYMVPAVYVRLEHFPLTVNGKLDKRALPDSEFVSTKDYVAPATDTEIAISQIWQEVLGLDRVGLKDDFFRIGGDSILSIQVSSRIRQAGYHCQVKDIFSYKTLEKLSAHLDNNQGGLAIKSEQGLLAGSFELLPVQQWFAEQVENGLFAKPSHWNQSILLRVPALDQSRLYSIIKELVSYHDVLRISYQKGEPAKSWHQLYKPEIPIPELRTLDVREHTELELHQLLTDWQSGFDLEGPLFQAGYLYGYGDGSARLYFSMHHLIVDGVSWRILAEDIKTLYEGRKLPAKGSSYRQWVSSVSQYAVDHAGESVYWERQLSGLPSYESLRSQQVDHSSATLMELPAELTKTLLQESSKAYHTEINDLLLTALAYALRDINQHEVQGITLEGHGREAIDSSIDHSRTIGWFTTMFPVSLELQSTLKESIQGIKESLRRIPNKGIGFGAFATREHSGFSHDNLAPISFNYLGQFGSHQAEDWQPAPEGSGVSMDGANGDRYLININGMVSGGKLCFTVVTRLGDKITQQLGDSLKTHLTGIIHHCEEQLVTVGECYTPSDFKEVSLSQGLLDQLQTRAQESQNGIAHIYTATSLQQGFIYHALSQSEDDAYRVQVLYDYHQGLDVDKYIEAWELCIAQYPILRTAFNWEEELVQIIYKRGKLNWKFHDISHLESQAERDAAIEAIQIEDRKQGFDLSKPTLLRLHIMKQSVEYYTVLKSEHHSISDGWSVPILLTSIHQNYQALVVGKQVSVKEDTAYLTAQQYISSNRESVSDYWSKTLSEVESVNDINGLLSEPLNLSSYKQVEESKASILTVEGDLYKSLKALSQREGITISVMVQFLWHKLLQVYSGSKQTIVGTTVSGRDLPVAGIEQSVGLYINTLPLIIDWENDNTILSQLHLLQDQLRGLSTHSFANLAKLQRDGERLFHSLFVYENYPLPKDAGTHEKGGAARVSLRKAIEKVDYPLSILAFEQGDTLTIKLQYDGLYLTDQKASSHIETLKYILEQVVKDPGQRHGKISLLSSPQYSQIVEQWNRTEKPYRQEATLHELFYEQVARSSESVALVYGDSRLSYGELNQRSNQLARYIRQQYLRKTGEELKADTLIALCLDRSPEMVIGILAVLKAGGAYVPIDPEYPQERIDYMLEDTGAQLVLTHQEIVDRGSVVLPSEKVLLIDLTSALYQSESSSDLDVNGSSSDLAYVIYTSGTTGRPKGVMVEHRSIHNTIADLYSLYREGLKVSAYTSYVFDVSVSEIFSTLLQGSELHLLPQSIRTDSVAISEYLQSNKIVLAYLPPVMLSQLPVVEHPHLKTLIYAGEPCDKYTAGQWSSRVKLYNYYGPTEASVYATFKEIGSDEVEQIGKPLSNTEVYVLDSFGQVVPVGVAGELYIGGSGIARGYLNNRELTSERFLPNRFKGDGSRLYRTGDLVRWLADGNLEYLGRNDEQVKIRGYRIELGEIEHALLKLEGIRQASVLCKERKSGSSVSKYLVGYYVSDVEWSPDRITDELSSVLPEYMVPAVYVRLEHFPLTVNGKLDKRKLPEPEFGSGDHVAACTQTERDLSKIWQSVLGVDQVSIRDDFFRIGGDSILSIQVSSRLRQLGYACHVRDIFTHRTIEKLSRHLETSSGESTYKTEQGLLTGSLDLLPVQRWFMEQVDNGRFRTPHHWNQSILIRVGKLDQDRLKAILPKLAWQHDMLRARYRKTISGWEQYYSESIEALTLHQLNVEGLSESAIESVLTGWQSGFDLERGPLFQAGLLEGYRDGSSRIYMAFHHLVVDAVSWRILLEDLRMLYEGKDLGLKASSYRQWVERVKSYGETHASEWSYWLSQVDQLPAASSYGEVEQQEFSDGFELGEKLTDELLHNCSQAYHTEVNDLLLTALAYALKDVSELGVHGVTLEGHGRELIDSQIDHSHTVGWFTTMYPVRLELQRDYAGSIRHIKESLREIPQKGIGFGALRMVHPGEEKVVLPAISFNYLGQFEASQSGEWELSGEGSGLNQGAGNVGENVITINGIVTQGVLRFGITTRLGAAQTIKLSNALRTHLEEIIAHCGKQRPGFTPSDFKGVRISQNLLDKLQFTADED